jgi:hypothetical protein
VNPTNVSRRPSQRRHRLSVIAAALATIITGGCMNTDEPAETPPEREFDETTAWIRMEEAAAEAIAELPDFPGFEERRLLELSCSHDGQTDSDYTQLELTYAFSAEDSATDLVHEDYVNLLREQWTGAGYDVHRDEAYGQNPVFYDLEARRPDGINYWLIAANYTSLVIQSGCVKKSGAVPECPPPLGGVTPENDIAGRRACGGNYDEPTAEADAIAPFGGTPAAFIPFPADGSRRDSFGQSSSV